MTYGEALLDGRKALVSVGEAAARDARLLLAAALGLDAAALIARSGDAIPEVAEARYRSYLKRRGEGEPVARILGHAEFWGLKLQLDRATLVPRPDTETSVEAVLEAAKKLPPGITICDLGTGSGAIVIALLKELEGARAVATDISAEALAVARANAETHGVADRVTFVNVGFADGPKARFDIVVSNPPYIRRGAIRKLSREVREHDPLLSLDGGPDGLDCYRAILARAGSLLAASGVLVLEVGYDQADSVAALCRKAGLSRIGFRRDLAGHRRVVIAERTAVGANPKVAKKALGKVG
jgi:release factor glutamine methyltransferase